MDDSEIFVFIVSGVLALVGVGVTRTGSLHALYFRDNPAPGIVRLGVLAAMAWIAYVLLFHADPSVTGVYVVFYLVMGFAIVKLFGQAMAAAYGARSQVDAIERRNVPAAVVVASFTLATGFIFGGSLWGEADPTGDDEGGWWIPVGFFLLGWLSLALVFWMFLVRERGRMAHRLRRDRSLADATATAFFLVASAWVLTDAVSGDFLGWRHGLVTFGWLAGLLIVREVFGLLTSRSPVDQGRGLGAGRLLETGFYMLLAFGSSSFSDVVEQWVLGL